MVSGCRELKEVIYNWVVLENFVSRFTYSLRFPQITEISSFKLLISKRGAQSFNLMVHVVPSVKRKAPLL